MSLTDKEIEIDLLFWKDSLKLTKKHEKTFIYDPVRKKNVVLLPEEFVRQLLIQFFIQKTNFHRNSIQVEKTITVHTLTRRFDMVIYGRQLEPLILVECKAPNVVVSQHTFDQIAVYNMKMKAPYLLVTNGKSTFCAKMDHENRRYDFLEKIPDSME